MVQILVLVIVGSLHPRKFRRLQIILEGQKAEMYFFLMLEFVTVGVGMTVD